jgi:glutaredoxin
LPVLFLRRWFRRCAPPPPLTVVLYTRPDCPLCDELAHALAQTRPAVPYHLRKVDIRTDARLHELYERSIPVLEIEGRVAFKGRASAAEIEQKLARAAQRRSLA